MEPVRHRRFSRCSFARHALQHRSDATAPACTDSVLLRALTLHCAHHSFGATEESSSTVAKNPSTIETSALIWERELREDDLVVAMPRTQGQGGPTPWARPPLPHCAHTQATKRPHHSTRRKSLHKPILSSVGNREPARRYLPAPSRTR